MRPSSINKEKITVQRGRGDKWLEDCCLPVLYGVDLKLMLIYWVAEDFESDIAYAERSVVVVVVESKVIYLRH